MEPVTLSSTVENMKSVWMTQEWSTRQRRRLRILRALYEAKQAPSYPGFLEHPTDLRSWPEHSAVDINSTHWGKALMAVKSGAELFWDRPIILGVVYVLAGCKFVGHFDQMVSGRLSNPIDAPTSSLVAVRKHQSTSLSPTMPDHANIIIIVAGIR